MPRLSCATLLLSVLSATACSDQASVQPTPAGDTSPASATDTRVESPPASDDAGEAPAGAALEPLPPQHSELLKPAINGFGLELWSQLRASSENLVISPASVHVALTMTWLGAKGETREQLSSALQLDPALDPSALAGELGGQLSAWNTGAKDTDEGLMTLHTANRLFGEQSYRFEAAYLSQLESNIRAPLERLDFAGAPERSRTHINQWVVDQTQGRIQGLIPPGGVTPRTGLVLTNAVYFLAQWAHRFDPAATSKASFQGTQGEVSVDMMRATNNYPYVEDRQVQVVRIPYAAQGYAMTVILPRAGQTLEQVEASLDAERVSTWLSIGGAHSVALGVPKFELAPASSLELGPALRELGITQAFEPASADFTGIADPADAERRLYISAVFHKTFVEVDEQGTEAAAATAVAMGYGRAVPPEPVSVTLDRPFLFFIHDGPGTVLFMGRLAAPS